MPDPLGVWKVDVSAPATDQVIGDLKKIEAELAKAGALEKSLHGSTEVVSQGVTKLGHSSRGAAQGLLALSQAVDDAQYGLRAVVNNIPQIVYMMGGGAGLAGAVGIAAVAVNQLVTHWDQLDKTFGHTEGMETAKGLLIELKQTLDDMGKSSPGIVGSIMRWWNGPQWREGADAAKRHADALKEVEDATKRISGIHGTEEKERGGLFQRALGQAGGGEAMARAIADKAMQGRKFATREAFDEARQQAVDHAMTQLNKGVEGENIPRQGLPRKLQNALVDIETEESAKRTTEQLKERQQIERDMAGKIRRERIEALQDQQELLHEQRKEEQKRMHELAKDTTYGSGQEYLRAVGQAAIDMVPKKQLEKLELIDKKLKDIHDALKKEQRARFG